MNIFKSIAAAVALSAIAIPASAAPGDILVRIRAAGVIPDMRDNIPGLVIGGDGNVVPEVDATYFFSDNIAIEVIAATTKHTIKAQGVGQLSQVWLLPPTLTAQYHFAPEGTSFRPYVGAGVNYTLFYGATDTGVLASHLSYGNSFGWALQAGADIPFGSNGMFFNVDVKKIFMSTRVKLGGVPLGSAGIDPWVIGVGIGIKL